jgi:hypothetical protein
LGQKVGDIFKGSATAFAGDAHKGSLLTFRHFLGISRRRGDPSKRFDVVLFDRVRDGGARA